MVLERLRQLDQATALVQCAKWGRLNFQIGRKTQTWGNDASSLERLFECSIPVQHHKSIRRALLEDEFIAPFSEAGILGLIALVARYCPQAGGKLVCDRPSRWSLLEVLFHVQSEFLPDAVSSDRLQEWFPYMTRSILANLADQNRWAYDMGRLHAFAHHPETGTYLVSKGRMSIDDWFTRRLGISVQDYEVMTNVHFGAAVCGASMAGAPPLLAGAVHRLHRLARQTPAELASMVPELHYLWEANRNLEALMIRPILEIESRDVVCSIGHLFNKFHRGLPYLVVESAKDLGFNDVALVRSEFGHLFQGYVEWLLSRWFSSSDVEIIREYYVEGDGELTGKKGDACEKDLVLLYDDSAYVIEVKSSVPTIAERQQCSLEGMMKWLAPVTVQAVHAAKGLVRGRAFRDRQMRCPIRIPKAAFPIGVTFEMIPLRYPFGEILEKHLGFRLPGAPFKEKQMPFVAPMQYLDVEQIEVWDDLVDLPRDARLLFARLRERALDNQIRFSRLDALIPNRADYASRPGAVRTLMSDGERTSSIRLKELQLQTSSVE